jgi:O-antigen/teichoic acid export membrane protein
MNGAGTKVIKNASILMISQLVTWGFSLLLTIFLPRYLGAAVTGEFVLAGSIWAIMSMLIGFGMDTLLTKEIARHPDRTPKLVGLAFILRIILFILTCALVALYLQLMSYSPTTVRLIWIIGISSLITQIGLVYQSALQGLEYMHFTSIAGIVSKGVNTILAITVVILGYSVYSIGFVNVISALVSALLLFIFLRRYYKPQVQFQITPALAMMSSSVPYLLSGMGLILYGQIDVLIISSMINAREVGWYGVTTQLTGTLLFIPVVFTTAIFPALTRAYSSQSNALPSLIQKSFDLMLLLSIPIGLGIFVIADPLVVLLYGSAFASSGPILSIMGIVVIFMYLNILVGQFLISTDRQNIWTIIMFIATLITIPLDLLLVPWTQSAFGNGAIGGAVSFVITEFGMCIAGIYLLPEGSLGWSNVRVGSAIIAAGIIMAAATWWCRNMFIAIPILVGALTYISLIAILRIVPKEDIAVFKEIAQGILRKMRRPTTKPVGITGA